MTSTMTPPSGAVEPATDVQSGRSRGLVIAVIVLAVVALGLGVALIVQAAGDDDGAAVPEDVEAVLDEFLVAMETNDYDAMKALVTDDFRRPFYLGDPNGTAPLDREVWTIEDFEFFEYEEPLFEIERVDAPVVRGEGPWYVSYAENWEYPVQWVDDEVTEWGRYEAIYTYVVVVDTDGELRIDDGYWVGHVMV